MGGAGYFCSGRFGRIAVCRRCAASVGIGVTGVGVVFYDSDYVVVAGADGKMALSVGMSGGAPAVARRLGSVCRRFSDDADPCACRRTVAVLGDVQTLGNELPPRFAADFCDRLLDLNTLLFFAMAGIFVGWWLTAALAVLALAPLLLLFLRPRWFAQMVKIIWVLCRRAKPRFFAALLAMCRHLQTVTRPGLYLPALLLALLSWLLEALAIVLIVSGVGGVLSVLWAIVALGTANIAGVLTLLPGGIGGQEVTLIYLLEDAGNTAGVALAATVVVRLFAVGGATLLGLPFFIFLSRTTVNGNASRHRAR